MNQHFFKYSGVFTVRKREYPGNGCTLKNEKGSSIKLLPSKSQIKITECPYKDTPHGASDGT